MMPVMDGFQLVETPKSDVHLRLIPFIMLTARADMQDKLRALRIGVDDYLLKPIVEEELPARIAALLERSRERRSEQNRAIPEMEDKQTIEEETPRQEFDTAWLESLEKIVSHAVQNDQLSVSWIADQMHVSERHFQRRLKALVGLSPQCLHPRSAPAGSTPPPGTGSRKNGQRSRMGSEFSR